MIKWAIQQYHHKLVIVVALMLHIVGAPALYAQELQWKVFGHLHNGLRGFCAAPIGSGRVLVIGGFSEQRGFQNYRIRGSVTNSCEMIDVKSRRITSAPSMHSPHANASMVQRQDSNIIIISGLNTDSTSTPICELYDRKKNEWRASGSLLIARHTHSAALLNDEEILVVGGRAKSNYAPAIAEAEIFNIRTGQSRFVSDFPDKLCGGVSVESHVFFSQSPIFLSGGGEGHKSYRLSNMYYFNERSSSWVCLGTFPEAGGTVSVRQLFDGRLVVAGDEKKAILSENNTNTNTNTNTNSGSSIYLENQRGFVRVGTMLKHRAPSSIEQWSASILLGIGGASDRQGAYNSTEWFDIQTHQSIEGPLMNDARSEHVSISFPTFDAQGTQRGVCLLAIGGIGAEGHSLSSVEILETTNPQLLEVPNPEIASQRLKKLLTSPTVIATLAGFILILIAGLIYLLYQVLIIRRQSKFSYQSNAVGGHK